jgi:hypothetical protein
MTHDSGPDHFCNKVITEHQLQATTAIDVCLEYLCPD